MKKIILTLIAFTFIGLAANSQAKKAAATVPQTSNQVQVIKDLNSAFDATSLTLKQKANCKEVIIWAARRKQAIKQDANLSANDKAAKTSEIDNMLNVRLAKMMSPSEIKLITPFMN